MAFPREFRDPNMARCSLGKVAELVTLDTAGGTLTCNAGEQIFISWISSNADAVIPALVLKDGATGTILIFGATTNSSMNMTFPATNPLFCTTGNSLVLAPQAATTGTVRVHIGYYIEQGAA